MGIEDEQGRRSGFLSDPLSEAVEPIRDIAAAVKELINGVAAGLEANSLEHGTDGIESSWTPLGYVTAAVSLPEVVEAVTAELVGRVHAEGYSWSEIAAAAGLSSAQVAHHRWAEGRDKRLMALRRRVGERRPSTATPNVPGRSAAEAARILGCDRRTLSRKVRDGEIQSLQVRLATGAVRTRYFLPGDSLPQNH